MNIVQITPGAGGMYCGVCMRDNALVSALKKMGHQATMIPLYLPLTLDEEDQSEGTPIFFSGINVYLQQKSGFFRSSPQWFHRMLASRGLLKWVGTKAAGTSPKQLGDLTLSMLRGAEGRQARELTELIDWLKTHPKPDLVCLGTALLLGMARKLRSELGIPVMCMFQGEDVFMDALSQPFREQCWSELAARAKEVDLLAAPSRYFANVMAERLGLDAQKIVVVPNGINLTGFDHRGGPGTGPPVIGYFARMCPDKGLDLLVDAYIDLRKARKVEPLKLKIGGSCGPMDERYVEGLRRRLQEEGLLGEVEFSPNPDHTGKVAFLKSLSVFSVPARFGEAFGLYVLEAMAAGVPVVQPRLGAFTEVVEATGGGMVYDAKNPRALADSLEELVKQPDRRKALGAAGKDAVTENFSAKAMAERMVATWEHLKSA
jgi:glycosyltransferase involved in cell wall biosynthesis